MITPRRVRIETLVPRPAYIPILGRWPTLTDRSPGEMFASTGQRSRGPSNLHGALRVRWLSRPV